MHHPMPVASEVADPAQHLVPEPAPHPAPIAGPTADAVVDPAVPAALVCRHTGTPCPALASLFASLSPTGPEAREWVQALAPCGFCRVAFEAERDRLRRLRLGQRERDILLGAARAGVLVLTEPGMARSLSASRRRAAQSLTKAGLVRSVSAAPNARSTRAAVTLTDLGRYVMAAYGRFLDGGKPVRWTRPATGVDLPGCDPSLLRDEALARTHTALRTTLDDLKGVLVAAITGRSKDPDMLDRVTHHLEQKATLLKAVLEPLRTRPVRA